MVNGAAFSPKVPFNAIKVFVISPEDFGAANQSLGVGVGLGQLSA